VSARRAWTSPAEIKAKVRRRWDDGSLLREYAAGAFEPLAVPISGPTASLLGDDLGAVQAWIAALDAGATVRGRRCYTIEFKQVGGRWIGRNLMPARALLGDWEEVWTLLGVDREVAAYRAVLDVVAGHPAIREAVLARPLAALEVGDGWPAVLAAFDWIEAKRRSGRYLREIDAPGVDTKFVERHRALLARLLAVSSSATGFASELGFASKPAHVRLRFDQSFAGLPRQLSEASFRLTELARLPVAVRTAVIVENEITYLSVSVPPEGVVIFGSGFDVDRPGALPWLSDADVFYWGDLDTHGFAILDRLRAWLPDTSSFLMDVETLLAHRDRWGQEPKPTSSTLRHLTRAEQDLYTDLVTGHHGDRVRLEQERIDWAWARSRWPWTLDT